MSLANTSIFLGIFSYVKLAFPLSSERRLLETPNPLHSQSHTPRLQKRLDIKRRRRRTPGNTEPATDRRSISYQRIDLEADWLIEEKGEEPLGLNAGAKVCLSLNFGPEIGTSGEIRCGSTIRDAFGSVFRNF